MDQKQLLKNFYLFTGVTSNDLPALEAIAERKTYIAGDLVYREGECRRKLCFSSKWEQWTLYRGEKRWSLLRSGVDRGSANLLFSNVALGRLRHLPRERTYLVRIPYERLSKVLAERPELALVVYRNACAFFRKTFPHDGARPEPQVSLISSRRSMEKRQTDRRPPRIGIPTGGWRRRGVLFRLRYEF